MYITRSSAVEWGMKLPVTAGSTPARVDDKKTLAANKKLLLALKESACFRGKSHAGFEILGVLFQKKARTAILETILRIIT